jgi:hypothetical protein
VQGVPEPAQPALIARRITGVLAGCVLALALAGCGGSDDDDAERGPPKLPAGFNLQLFNCSDWNAADAPVREYVLERLHAIANDQVTGPGVQGRGSVLTDEEATKLFDNTCSSPRARGFVLYKLYAFSRGFRGRPPPGT